MIHNGESARLVSFLWYFVRACVFVCMRMLVNDSLSVKETSLSGWFVTGGRVTSLAWIPHSEDRKHHFMISPRKETLLSQSAMPLLDLIWRLDQYTQQRSTKVCSSSMTIAWEMAISKALFLYEAYVFRITKWGFFCFVRRALKWGDLVNLSPPCPYPLTFSVSQQYMGV